MKPGDVVRVDAAEPVYGGVFATVIDTVDGGRSALLSLGGDKTIVALAEELTELRAVSS